MGIVPYNHKQETYMAQKLDAVDLQIIELLAQDGRLTCAEIARAIGHISERSVRYRLDRLIQDKVVRVLGMVDPQAFGYSVVANVNLEVDPGQIMEIARQVADHPLVTYVACLATGSDICTRLVTRDNNELFQFVSEVLGKIPGVKKITTSVMPVVVKDVLAWQIPPAVSEEIS
jgi:Lrp/AsnC family transcriptional regulator for asnA, asnC and gidA